MKINPEQIPPYVNVYLSSGAGSDGEVFPKVMYGCRCCNKFAADTFEGIDKHLIERHGLGHPRVRSWADRAKAYEDLPFADEVPL